MEIFVMRYLIKQHHQQLTHHDLLSVSIGDGVTPGKSFVATPFPVHFCSKAVATVPYQHPDSAALRILAKLLSSKYLHSQIREKGGAYGGGAASNPSSGVFSFYSYRDPNCQQTLDAFDRYGHSPRTCLSFAIYIGMSALFWI